MDAMVWVTHKKNKPSKVPWKAFSSLFPPWAVGLGERSKHPRLSFPEQALKSRVVGLQTSPDCFRI